MEYANSGIQEFKNSGSTVLRFFGSKIALVTCHHDLAKDDFVGAQAIIGKDPEMAARFLVPPATRSAKTVLDLA